MDWLKVAAVTGAGYAAKYLKNFSQEKEGLYKLPSGSSSVEKADSSSLIQQNSAGKTDQLASFDKGNGSLSDGILQGRTPCNTPSPVEMASASRFEGDYCDNSNDTCETSTFGTSNVKGPRRGRSSFRSRQSNLHNLKPRNSLESCLMAQLYKERAEMEEHVLGPLPSPYTPALRPFVVTDGTQIIGQSICDSFNLQVGDGKDKAPKKVYSEAYEAIFGGIPPLPEIRLEEVSSEKNLKKRKVQHGKFSCSQEMPNVMQISPKGSPTGAVLFCLGVSIGIMSCILANKTEVTKLHDLLKQTENLVQDLQEELEMKDALTVKELVSEDNVYPCMNENSADKKIPTPHLVHSDSDMLTCGVEASDSQKEAETRESMSTIEAELEAELERLELNMKKSTLQESLSDDDELDPDFVAEVVQGELRADIFSGKPSSDPSPDHSSSSISTPSPKQAVSPRELSLCLHQVIQSRLEQRVTELEAALEESQNRIVQLQSEQQLNYSLRRFSHIDVLSSSSTQGSPIIIGTPVEKQSQSQSQGEPPLVMNLSGEALDAYHEARQELEKIIRSENEENTFEMYKESSHRILIEKQNGTENGLFLFQSAVVGPKTSMTSSGMIEQSEKFCMDESKDEEDEMALLIKQIVEKTRQGSPAVLQAHRAMVFLDKNEE